MPVLTTMVLCPRANQNLHLSGSRWSCLNPAFPGQEVARCPVHSQDSGQHPSTQPRILTPSRAVRELAVLPGVDRAAVLICWVPLLLPLKASLGPRHPLESQWWHIPKPSSSEFVGKPPPTLSLQRQQTEMELRCYGIRVTPMSNAQKPSGPTST